MTLLGIDCTNPKCRHDNIRGYRLRMMVYRNSICRLCGAQGVPVKRVNAFGEGPPEAGWFRCLRGCKDQIFQTQVDWRAGVENEHNDMVVRKIGLESMLAQMYALGVDDPDVGKQYTIDHAHDPRHTLPHWCDYRWVQLTEEALPRTAVYFRYEIKSGEFLSPDNSFQCLFSPGASAAERETAGEIRLSAEQLGWIRSGTMPGAKSMVQCQHCGVPLDLRAFTTMTLREVEKGD